MLTSTLALIAFASCSQPLAEHSCLICSRVDPNAPRRHWFCCCCHRLRVVIVISIAVVLITATPTIAELMLPVEPSRCHFPPRR
jgi:hypothetical protein